MIIKKHILVCVCMLTVALGCARLGAQENSGPTPFPADHALFPGKGVVRVFPWMVDNRNWFWTKRAEAQGSIVFVGDSLTGNWGNVGKAFPKLKVANRGIGGDVTRGVLFRFQEDVLDLHPKAIVLLAGSNDLSAKEDPSDALSNLSDIIALAQKQAPGAPIVLCTVPPRDSKEAPIDIKYLKELNEGIVKLAAGRPGITLLDLFPLFVLPDGTGMPDPQYFKKDKLHFDNPGYAKWAKALEPVFTGLKLE